MNKCFWIVIKLSFHKKLDGPERAGGPEDLPWIFDFHCLDPDWQLNRHKRHRVLVCYLVVTDLHTCSIPGAARTPPTPHQGGVCTILPGDGTLKPNRNHLNCPLKDKHWVNPERAVCHRLGWRWSPPCKENRWSCRWWWYLRGQWYRWRRLWYIRDTFYDVLTARFTGGSGCGYLIESITRDAKWHREMLWHRWW